MTKLLMRLRCEAGRGLLEKKTMVTESGERVGGCPHADGTGPWVSSSRLDRGLDWGRRPDLVLHTFKRRVGFTLWFHIFGTAENKCFFGFLLSIKFYRRFHCPSNNSPVLVHPPIAAP